MDINFGETRFAPFKIRFNLSNDPSTKQLRETAPLLFIPLRLLEGPVSREAAGFVFHIN